MIKLTKDNYQQYLELYRDLYSKSFNRKFDETVLKHLIDNIVNHDVYYHNENNVQSFMIFQIHNSGKYKQFTKSNHFIFLSELLAYPKYKGLGSVMLRKLINISNKFKCDIVTVPINDKAANLYFKFNFALYKPHNKKIPSNVMVKYFNINN